MKIIILAALCSLVAAGPIKMEHPHKQVEILQQELTRDDHNQYAGRYISADGTIFEEVGFLKQIGDSVVLAKKGSVKYFSPEGIPFSYKYIADENGFNVIGDHLPTEATQKQVHIEEGENQHIVLKKL